MSTLANFVDDARFSRIFELPASPANGRHSPLTVKYADYGYRNEAHPEQENVHLFFGPLMASRLLYVSQDELAKKHKVRFINPDRPGFGGTDVAAEHRMALWREVVPALLAHLGIQHVSIGCASGGTIYALDMALHHPHLFHPEYAYLAIGSPWIFPTHTDSKALALVQALPASAIRRTDVLARLIANHIGPLVGATFGLSGAVVAKIRPPANQPLPVDSTDAGGARDGPQFEEGVRPYVLRRTYAEGVHGMSTDAVLLMKKGVGWSDWGDYDVLVPRLVEALQAVGRRLRVDVFYAEKDFLIGDAGSKGPKWFDACWAGEQTSGVVDYRSRTVEGADHDGIWRRDLGASEEVFERIGRHFEDRGQET